MIEMFFGNANRRTVLNRPLGGFQLFSDKSQISSGPAFIVFYSLNLRYQLKFSEELSCSHIIKNSTF